MEKTKVVSFQDHGCDKSHGQWRWRFWTYICFDQFWFVMMWDSVCFVIHHLGEDFQPKRVSVDGIVRCPHGSIETVVPPCKFWNDYVATHLSAYVFITAMIVGYWWIIMISRRSGALTREDWEWHLPKNGSGKVYVTIENGQRHDVIQELCQAAAFQQSKSWVDSGVVWWTPKALCSDWKAGCKLCFDLVILRNIICSPSVWVCSRANLSKHVTTVLPALITIDCSAKFWWPNLKVDVLFAVSLVSMLGCASCAHLS